MKQWATCREWKDEKDLNWRNKALSIRHPTYRECHKSFQQKWYEDNKEKHLENVYARKQEVRTVAREYVNNYLSTHPCTDCGEGNTRVLEFHHRHGKDMAINKMIGAGCPISTIQSVIDKCNVLCANCHRKNHTSKWLV